MGTLTVFEKARSRLLIQHPFFAGLLLSVPSLVNYDIETACTDMIRIWYNPDFIESLKVTVAMFVMAHEAMHIMLKHGLRMGHRDPELANIAMDHAINLMLLDYGFELWADCCCDKRFKGMPWEQIYEILKKEDDAKPKPKPGDGDGESEGDGDGKPKPGKGQGKPRQGTHKDRIGRDVMRPQNASKEEIARIETRIDAIVAQAAQQAQMAGKFPASLALLVNGIVNPPLPWYDVLRDLMLQTVKELECWSRPNRRQPMLPSYRNPGMGTLVLIGDTSGSMLSDQIFAQIGAEVTECNTICKPERTIVVWADYAECSHMQEFAPGDDVVMEPHGGGGTDMRLPLAYVEQFDPAVVVLVTDAETPWPDEPCPFPLIVLTTRNNEAVKQIPNWAMSIPIR